MSSSEFPESHSSSNEGNVTDIWFKESISKLKEKIHNNKILLINTPQIIFSEFSPERAQSGGYQAYPPLGLQCLSAALNDREVEVNILDMNYEFLKGANESHLSKYDWIPFLEAKLDKFDASIVGVSSMYDVFQPNFMNILKLLKNRNNVVITGGPSATYRADKLIGRELADLACLREAEGQIRAIVDEFYNFESPRLVPGIVFKSGGEVRDTGRERDNLISRLDLVSEHKKFPTGDYYKYATLGPMQAMAGKEIPFGTIQVTRGCRFDCDFCCVNELSGRGLRKRSLEDVLEEAEFLYRNYGKNIDGAKSFYIEFIDDDLGGIGNEQLSKLLLKISQTPSRVGEPNGRIFYGIQNGLVPVHLDENILRTMNETGCMGWKVGIESGNDEILRAMRKPGRLEGFKRFSERKRIFATNTSVAFNYIIGTIIRGPSFDAEVDVIRENFGQMIDSYLFAKDYNTDWGSFSIFQDSKGDEIIENETESMARTASRGSEQRLVRKGVDIFDIDYNEFPSKEQLKEIWRTFDFLTNYVFNPRIRDGQEKMFIRYAHSIHENYPKEVGPPLYMGLVHRSLGEDLEAEKNIEVARNLYDSGQRELVDLFNLGPILTNFPTTSEDAKTVIKELIQKYDRYGR